MNETPKEPPYPTFVNYDYISLLKTFFVFLDPYTVVGRSHFVPAHECQIFRNVVSQFVNYWYLEISLMGIP